jgi:site-specific DNA-methyltransferase (adenine-specific)
VFCQVEAALKWAHALQAGGLVYRRTGIWVKPDGMPQFSGDRPGMGYESLVIAHAPGRSTWNGGGRHGVWTFNKIGPDDRDRTGHETQKPLALMEALVRDFTDEGDLVLDPFAGSGTTGVACRRLGRRFLGWERDPKYAAIAEKRIAGAREQMRMFEGTGT